MSTIQLNTNQKQTKKENQPQALKDNPLKSKNKETEIEEKINKSPKVFHVFRNEDDRISSPLIEKANMQINENNITEGVEESKFFDSNNTSTHI